MSEKEPPDLVCMDIELMGKIDGIEAAGRSMNMPICRSFI